MRAVVQRVASAAVEVEGRTTGRIGPGLLVLLGAQVDDSTTDLAWIASRVVHQKLFPGPGGRLEVSLRDHGGGLLVVSQFTLLASTRKGTKPSWHRAAGPAEAQPLYDEALRVLARELERPVESGIFGAMMQVRLVNDGPVTLVLDSRLKE